MVRNSLRTHEEQLAPLLGDLPAQLRPVQGSAMMTHGDDLDDGDCDAEEGYPTGAEMVDRLLDVDRVEIQAAAVVLRSAAALDRWALSRRILTVQAEMIDAILDRRDLGMLIAEFDEIIASATGTPLDCVTAELAAQAVEFLS